MEKVQGLQYRNEDGPTMQFWPIQHEIFPRQGHNDLPQGMPQAHLAARPSYSFAEESTGPHQLPLMWENLSQRDGGNVNASGSKNWKDSWEWNGFLFTAQPTTSGNNLYGGGHPQQGQDSKFKSSSPFDKSEVNGALNEPTLLELGLNNNSLLMDDDDGLLALKLGGNGHLGGADELSPNVKRSRHSPPETQRPRCQVDDCTADLQNAKDYHRRHKVCEFHAKASKAPVSRIMQRFCQQCSRFHLLQEFDDDRRSCRRRLAGHNRRRRKTQPDTATALACLLADQNALSRIISPLGHLQGKDELEKLLWVLNRGESLQQALLNARAASGDSENKSTIVGGAPSNDLVNAIAKSQLLSNLLLSNPALACNLPAMAAPADTSISVLSNALLATLSQLQHKNNANVSHGGPAFIQETGKQPDSCTNALVTHAIAKQDAFCRHSTGEQPVSLAFPSSTKHTPVVREPITPPICSDKSNDSNGDSMDERIHIDSAQRGGMNESYIQQDVRHFKDPSKGYHNTSLMLPVQKFQTAGAIHARDAVPVHPDTQSTSLEEHLETKALGSDHSSDSGLDKQEQTFQLWFKIFDRGPADLPSSLRKQMLEWLDHLPTEMEGYIRPGCIILTVFLHMPVHAWEKLCRNIEGSLHKLVQSPDGDFWRKGRVLVHLGEASAFIIDGNVYLNSNPKPLQTPYLVSVQPFAVVMGENVDLILKGHNLRAPGTKVICSYEGKCRDKELALPTSFQERKRDRDGEQGMPLAGPDAQREHAVTFRVGPFKNMGHSFIEVEGQTMKGNTFPIIIADRSICEEVCSLEKEFIRSLENNRPSEKMRPSKIEADITHFLYELGWLLHRFQWKVHYIDSQEFSPARYRWLLRFSVEHGCCAVVRRILDLLFSTGGDSMEHVNLRALETLSEANLLHVAVRSNSRAMVEFLLAYTAAAAAAAAASDLKHRCIFRPDTPCYGGLTPLHVAASMHAANGVVDALTNAPEELWAMAWTSAKDSVGQTPLMYALAAGNHASIELVQNKLQKLGNTDTLEKKRSDARPPHLALSISGEVAKPTIPSSPRKGSLTKQIQHCTCRGREIRTQNLPLRIRGFKAGSVCRPFVLSMLAIAAVCVCVGVLMKGPPSVNFVQGPFVWDSIKFGFN